MDMCHNTASMQGIIALSFVEWPKVSHKKLR